MTFKTTLVQEPKISGSAQRFLVKTPTGDNVFIKTSRLPEFHYSQTLLISGKIDKQLLGNEKPILAINFPKIEAVKNDEKISQNPIDLTLRITALLRQKLALFFQKNLPPKSSALLLGIVFGIKQDLPSSFSDNLRLSGVYHVIAASGMNVTMVGGFLSAFFLLFFKRQTALVFSILSILFYTLLAGAEPSIVRASIMAILAFLASILGRQRLAVYSLFIAGYLMLFFSPDLLSNIGFQLSYLSTLGLLYIKPLIEGKGTFKKILDKTFVGEDLTTTVSAQIATLPVLLLNFGTYSLWSALVNLLVLWTVPLLMILGGFGAFFSFIEPIGRIFLYFSLPLLLYFEKTVTFFGEKGGVINLETFPLQFVFSYYLFLLAGLLFLVKKIRV
ncbi:MAG: ComEC/Rec2 family competence protein [Patescibacteria group bacterium]|nr:ComEC/Rec2 family competence protein [Patescibacteria group bacterium]